MFINVNINSVNSCWWNVSLMWCVKLHFTSMSFLSKNHNQSLIMRKTSDKSQIPVEGQFKNPWQFSPPNCQGHQKPGRPETLHQEGPKERWGLNVMWYLGQDPGTEKKRQEVKTKEVWIKYELWLVLKIVIRIYRQMCPVEFPQVGFLSSPLRGPSETAGVLAVAAKQVKQVCSCTWKGRGVHRSAWARTEISSTRLSEATCSGGQCWNQKEAYDIRANWSPIQWHSLGEFSSALSLPSGLTGSATTSSVSGS